MMRVSLRRLPACLLLAFFTPTEELRSIFCRGPHRRRGTAPESTFLLRGLPPGPLLSPSREDLGARQFYMDPPYTRP